MRDTAPGLRLSRWGQEVAGSDWPTIYQGLPRPFQPGLADEREFPAAAWGRCLRHAANPGFRKPDSAANHPALQDRDLPPPRIIFVTPSHQYPTGRLMPIGRRHELLRFARTVGAAIIEDDYDGEFHYEGRPVAALAALDPTAPVFYVGTFSKSMSATVRVGYVVVPEFLVSTFTLAQRHLGTLTSTTLQSALAEFMPHGRMLNSGRARGRSANSRANDDPCQRRSCGWRRAHASPHPGGG